MGRGKKLNKSEIQVILSLKKQNFSISEIAVTVKRSRKVIYNLLKDINKYGRKKSSGRPSVLSAREKRAILRVASNSCLTAKQIAHEVGVETNIRNVRRVLQRCDNIKRKKLKKKPPLTASHKEHRLRFAEEHVQWKKKWRKIIFTDEKKFNLDGPDGFSYYYHDIRKEELQKIRRQMGGGNIMVWAGIGYNGKTDIQFISGRMNSTSYLNLIKDQIRKHAERIAGTNFMFQQDNAAVHTAKIVKTYFLRENIPLLEWPARSPDLNIIENCWGELARAVYAGGKQYENINQLKQSITQEWSNLSQNNIRNLYNSLPKRMIEVLENKGGSTHY